MKLKHLGLYILIVGTMAVTLTGCGSTSETTVTKTTTNSATDTDTPTDTQDQSVTKTIGTYAVKISKETAAVGEAVTVTITPPDSSSYTKTLKVNSGSNMNIDNIITQSLTLTSGGSGTKTYSVKGTQSGQVIAVSVEISGQTEKAEFEITVE